LKAFRLEPVERLYTKPIRKIERSRFSRRISVYNAAFTRPAIAAALDDAPVRRIFGTPEETNARFKYLMAQGQTGLVGRLRFARADGLGRRFAAFGRRSRQMRRRGFVARRFGRLVRRHPARRGHGFADDQRARVVFLAMYLVVAEKQGADFNKISGTLQNDILKEYIAQKEWIYPIKPAMKLVIDTFEFCTRHVPKYNPISVSGYHIREAGATALQELAFTCATASNTFNTASMRFDVDEFVPRISFFFNAHNDFFEEIAKYRAARVIWAKTMRERFGAKNPRTMQLRFHTQTAGVSLTVQQPLNNIAASPFRRSPEFSAERRSCTPTLTTKRSRCRPTRPRSSLCERSRSSPKKPAS
jgi:methylmalonyl-CoA mutase N-terminal domain/subunit